MKNESTDLVYVHLQASERFSVISGMTFREFGTALDQPLQSLLLLKHQYRDGEFNMNTLLNFVPADKVQGLQQDDTGGYGDFCWIDFEDDSRLDDLEPQEIAELLYIGHCKNHLRPPFYRKLNNQFVYLAHDDGWFNKVYWRTLDMYYEVLGRLISNKLSRLNAERSWLGIRKKSEVPAIPSGILKALNPLMAEGAVFSLQKMQQTRTRIEIPVWVPGDYVYMDDMRDAYKEISREKPAALAIFQKKSKEWSVQAN